MSGLDNLFNSDIQESKMIIEKEYIFPTTLITIKMRNWEEKKRKLLTLYEANQHQFERHPEDLISTDYNSREDYDEMSSSVEYILSDEMYFLKNNLDGCMNMKMKFVWFQHYINRSFHSIHNHGSLGYSGVCYINYNPKEHKPLTFVSSHNDFTGDFLQEYTPKNITEGTTIIFPSILNHYVSPVTSSEERLILSFNLRMP